MQVDALLSVYSVAWWTEGVTSVLKALFCPQLSAAFVYLFVCVCVSQV